MANCGWWLWKLALVLLSVRMILECECYRYNTRATTVPGKINVHLVAHTHDDVGWLKTVDQYYLGSRNDIQEAGVQYILDSVVAALQSNPDRKFIYVEQAFFQRWWKEQDEDVRSIVKGFINSGQLEFINGGWCMHDEATTHYIDMIDQTTLGHLHIKNEFGKIPRIGWQIDPFGHSAVQAYLLGAELGFDGLFFGRIDYQDRSQRYHDKSLEVIWQGSKTFGSDAEIFTSIFPRAYEAPDEFSYEEEKEIPVQDDPNLFDYNVDERVNTFVEVALSQANITRTNHIMWTMGTDFKYEIANKWFVQMDKLIHYVNLDGRVNAMYSTPSIYLDAKHAANESWPSKDGDFFPYADDGDSYWTGYFTSRPAIKGYVRFLSAYLQAARQLEFFSGRKEKGPNTDKLWDALSIVQHHDGVSGTEKQHVANDYAKRLAIGASEAEAVINSAVSSATSDGSVTFMQCPLLNVSYCPSSEALLQSGKSLVVVAYNSLGWPREEYIRIPVNSDAITVKDDTGKTLKSQLVPLSNATIHMRRFYVKAHLGVDPGKAPKYWLYFKATVVPLGFSSFYISVSTSDDKAEMSTIEVHEIDEDGAVSLSFPVVGADVQQSFHWYAGYADSGQDSGAYIFLPKENEAKEVVGKKSKIVIKGPLLEEVQFEAASWAYQAVRKYKDKEHAVMEFLAGPVPVDDGVGKEFVTRFTTRISSQKTFYTDSNGRDFIKRVRDHRSDWKLTVTQPVAGNYYPVNSGIFLKDNSTEFSILVDRSMGGTSLKDGQLELMLHRRLLADDARGVDEPINEVVCVDEKCEGLSVQGSLYINVNTVKEAARWRRTQEQSILFPLHLVFTQKADSVKLSRTAMSSGYSLPPNVAIITLQEVTDGGVWLRLAHIYEIDEDEKLSTMASVDLKLLFGTQKIKSAVEVSLSANQPKLQMKRMQWRTNRERGNGRNEVVRGGPLNSNDMLVQLGPMEIRTFHLQF